MMKAGDTQNQENQHTPEETRDGGQVKNVKVVMLDSESVISPPVVREKTEEKPRGTDFPAFENQKFSRSSFLFGKNAYLFAAGLVLFLSGVLVAALLFNRQQTGEQQPSKTIAVKPETPVQTQPPILQEQASDTNEISESQEPSESVSTKKPSIISTTNLPVARTENVSENAVTSSNNPQTAVVADGKTQAELNASLDNLIDATNNRNVGKQMDYYAPKVDAFYLSRNATSKDVRE